MRQDLGRLRQQALEAPGRHVVSAQDGEARQIGLHRAIQCAAIGIPASHRVDECDCRFPFRLVRGINSHQITDGSLAAQRVARVRRRNRNWRSDASGKTCRLIIRTSARDWARRNRASALAPSRSCRYVRANPVLAPFQVFVRRAAQRGVADATQMCGSARASGTASDQSRSRIRYSISPDTHPACANARAGVR